LTPRIKRLLAGLGAGLIGALIALSLWGTGALDSWEALTFDLRARILAKPSATTEEIRLILLDRNSLNRAQQQFGYTWPWPRKAYVPIIDFCRLAGASSLTLDVIFNDPSVYGSRDDETLSFALKQFGRAILPGDFAKLDGSDESWPQSIPLPTLQSIGTIRSDGSNVATFPIPDLTEGTTIGNANITADPDEILRRAPLFVLFDHKLVPSLPLAIATFESSSTPLQFHSRSVTLLGKNIPIDEQGSAIINYRGPKGTFKTYKAADIMESRYNLAEGKAPLIDPTEFKNKHVMFGVSAPALYDLRSTPVGNKFPGIEIDATVLDNILSGDFIHPVGQTANTVAAVLFGILTAMGVMEFRTTLMSSAASFVILSAPMTLSFILYRMGFWFGLTLQLTACVFSILIAGTIKYITEGRQRNFIKSAFSQYLSPNVIEQLLRDPSRLSLGGERKSLTIFFADLVGFTSIAESMEPEDLTAVTNEYLTAMTETIQELGGTIDKYEGDGIVAFWNAPLNQPDHAQRAVLAAIDCQKKLATMRPGLAIRTGHEFHVRIGINTGPAVVGNFGSSTRFDYTAMGDSVNIAARLEGINKQFGTTTLISQTTRDLLDNTILLREISRVIVPGKQEPVTIHAPLSLQERAHGEKRLKRFEQGLAFFYAGNFNRAFRVFSSLAETDPVSSRYRDKCAELAASPPARWDGIWFISTK